MTGWWTMAIAAAALGATACSAPASCSGSFSELLESQPMTGSTQLTGAGSRDSRSVRVTLVGGPVLAAQDDVAPSLSIQLRLTYPDGPTGAVELPRLRVFADTSTFETPAFLPTDGTRLAFPLPARCSASASNACLGEATVGFERLDGAIFPPVDVEWTLSASTGVSDCPPSAAAAELELEELSP